jgi:hypothetical protein
MDSVNPTTPSSPPPLPDNAPGVTPVSPVGDTPVTAPIVGHDIPSEPKESVTSPVASSETHESAPPSAPLVVPPLPVDKEAGAAPLVAPASTGMPETSAHEAATSLVAPAPSTPVAPLAPPTTSTGMPPLSAPPVGSAPMSPLGGSSLETPAASTTPTVPTTTSTQGAPVEKKHKSAGPLVFGFLILLILGGLVYAASACMITVPGLSRLFSSCSSDATSPNDQGLQPGVTAPAQGPASAADTDI